MPVHSYMCADIHADVNVCLCGNIRGSRLVSSSIFLPQIRSQSWTQVLWNPCLPVQLCSQLALRISKSLPSGVLGLHTGYHAYHYPIYIFFSVLCIDIVLADISLKIPFKALTFLFWWSPPSSISVAAYDSELCLGRQIVTWSHKDLPCKFSPKNFPEMIGSHSLTWEFLPDLEGSRV